MSAGWLDVNTIIYDSIHLERLRSSSREKIGFFIILIDSLYLQESVVPGEKFEKNYTPKRRKTVKTFHLKFWRHRNILILRFFTLAIYVINSSAWASCIFKKIFYFLNIYHFILFFYLVSRCRSIRWWKRTEPKRLKYPKNDA